jgi:hypothetical protein
LKGYSSRGRKRTTDSPHFEMGEQSFHTSRSLSATVLLLAGGLIKCEVVQRRPRALGWVNHVQPRLDEKPAFVVSFARSLYPPDTDLPRVLGERVGSNRGRRLLHVALLRSATRNTDQVGLSQRWEKFIAEGPDCQVKYFVWSEYFCRIL